MGWCGGQEILLALARTAVCLDEHVLESAARGLACREARSSESKNRVWVNWPDQQSFVKVSSCLRRCCLPADLSLAKPCPPPHLRHCAASHLARLPLYERAPSMLDTFEILTTSGVVLWSRSYAPVGPNIINSLIRDVFIEERIQPQPEDAGQKPTYRKEGYTLKWTAAKDLGLIFVVRECLPSQLELLHFAK